MAIDEHTATEDRIQDYRLEQRQKLLDAWSTAAASGASLMRPDPTYRPLSEEVKRRIKDQMRRWFPQPGDPSPVDRLPAGQRALFKRTIARFREPWQRVIVTDERRGRGHGPVHFDCRNGFPASLELPLPPGLSEHQKPVIVTLPAENWDQSKADYDLDRVRWAQGRPLVWLQPGQSEPE